MIITYYQYDTIMIKNGWAYDPIFHYGIIT